MTDKISRRAIVLRGLQIPVGGALFVALGGCGSSGERSGAAKSAANVTVCADPATMTDAEHDTRNSLGYTEVSPNPAQVCAGCAFFHPSAEGGVCGTCDMLSGHAANAGGRCNSWSAKS